MSQSPKTYIFDNPEEQAKFNILQYIEEQLYLVACNPSKYNKLDPRLEMTVEIIEAVRTYDKKSKRDLLK